MRPTWDIHGPLGEVGLLDVAVWRCGDGYYRLNVILASLGPLIVRNLA